MRYVTDASYIFDHAEDVRLTDDDTAHCAIEVLIQSRCLDPPIHTPGEFDNTHARHSVEVSSYNLTVLWVQRARQENGRPLWHDPSRHQHRFGRSRRAIVHAGVSDI